jgi:hypothetical protein
MSLKGKRGMINNRFLRRALKTLYFAILGGIIVWGLPIFQAPGKSTSIATEVRKLSGPFFRWSGLWQGWAMFAPNPSNQNISVQIAIEFHDGTREFLLLPQLFTMNRWEAYKAERHRKFIDNLRRNSSSKVWPRAADYYRNQFEQQKPVKRIDMVRFWTIVPPPDLSESPPPPPTYMEFEKSYIFYTAKYPLPELGTEP